MACCILCLNNLDDNEALQIDECYAGSFSGREMIKSHFEFYEVSLGGLDNSKF